jgi:uncharacterized protein
MSWHHWQGDMLELKLYIQPGAQRTQVMGLYLDRLKVRIAAPPVEGKANKALLGFLADQFGVARSKVRLLSGDGQREKRVVIHSPVAKPEWFVALS